MLGKKTRCFLCSFGGQCKLPPANSRFYSVCQQEELKRSDCTGSSVLVRWQQHDVPDPLRGLSRSRWHAPCVWLLNNSTTPQRFVFSSPPCNGYVLLSGEHTAQSKHDRTTYEKICIKYKYFSPSPTSSTSSIQAVCHCQHALSFLCWTAIQGSCSSLLSFHESEEALILSLSLQQRSTAPQCSEVIFSFFPLFS